MAVLAPIWSSPAVTAGGGHETVRRGVSAGVVDVGSRDPGAVGHACLQPMAAMAAGEDCPDSGRPGDREAARRGAVLRPVDGAVPDLRLWRERRRRRSASSCGRSARATFSTSSAGPSAAATTAGSGSASAEYARETGTMYRSLEAFCMASVAQAFARTATVESLQSASGNAAAAQRSASRRRPECRLALAPAARPWPSLRSPGTPPAPRWRARTAPCGRPGCRTWPARR